MAYTIENIGKHIQFHQECMMCLITQLSILDDKKFKLMNDGCNRIV